VTLAPLPPDQPANHAAVTDPIFAVLDTREIDVLIAVISAGWRITSAVHPLLCPLWDELRELLADLHIGWEIAFARENPHLARLAAG
jgi:hypothetical protein